MVVFSLVTFLGSTYTKVAVSFLVGSASIRAWFKKEIAAGKAAVVKVETAVKADVAVVAADVKKI